MRRNTFFICEQKPRLNWESKKTFLKFADPGGRSLPRTLLYAYTTGILYQLKPLLRIIRNASTTGMMTVVLLRHPLTKLKAKCAANEFKC
jgi:hypothetical protein